MGLNTQDMLAQLAAVSTRARRKSDLEVFVEFVRAQGTIVSAWSHCVEAEGHDISRYFRPEGGLTLEHFDALVAAAPEARGELARALVGNMLHSRGLSLKAEHRAVMGMAMDFWVRLETAEEFESAARDTELEYHRRRGEWRREREVAAALDEDKINPQGDWKVIVTSKGTFNLTPLAQQVFPVIYRAHKEGRHVTESYIRKATGIDADRFDRCLRRSKLWGVIVAPVPGRRGFWRLLP